jgi:hypothetical protein
MNIKKLFNSIGAIDKSEDRYCSEYYTAFYNGVELIVFEHSYDYAPENKLVCIDRDDCFNKESQCPIIFFTEDAIESELVSDLDFLISEDGKEESCSSFWGDNKFKLYQKNARLRFYQEIWDVEHYVEQKNKELGIDFYNDFPYLTWNYLTITDSVDKLKESNDYFENEK